ncbi:hypothetical protein ACWGET_20300 [Streptomyces zaomyceticus]
MLRGGQGGQVRLKLYLSLLWMHPPEGQLPEIAFPARAWAELFDLDDPETKGARRVNDAQKWLEANGFVFIASMPGHANAVTVLDDTGTREPYVMPGQAAKKERSALGRAKQHRYIQVERTFWTKGHIAVLSGAGVAMYLALLAEQGGSKKEGSELWFSPNDAERRFGLKADARSKGLRELAAAGLVLTRRRPVDPTGFGTQRMRNVHVLQPSRLNQTACIRTEASGTSSPWSEE